MRHIRSSKGIDPAGIYLTLQRYNQAFIDREDATYVQIIHTDTLLFGTSFQCGTVDIYIRDIPISLSAKHSFGPYLHMVTSMGKINLVATKSGDSKIIPFIQNSTKKKRVVDKDEVIIGVYSELEESKRGQQFYFSLKNSMLLLKFYLFDFVKMYLPEASL